MSPRPLIVGQAPARSMPPGARALEGSDSLKRLASYACTTPAMILELFDTTNLVQEWHGKADESKWDHLDAHQAFQGAQRVKSNIIAFGIERVILLGRTTAKYFGLPLNCPLYEWQWYEDHEDGHRYCVAISPHPGGTNMHLNDLDNRAKMQAFWIAAVEHEMTKRVSG